MVRLQEIWESYVFKKTLWLDNLLLSAPVRVVALQLSHFPKIETKHAKLTQFFPSLRKKRCPFLPLSFFNRVRLSQEKNLSFLAFRIFENFTTPDTIILLLLLLQDTNNKQEYLYIDTYYITIRCRQNKRTVSNETSKHKFLILYGCFRIFQMKFKLKKGSVGQN